MFDNFIDKTAKWGALLAIILPLFVIFFQNFTPQYQAWRKTYPGSSVEDYEDSANESDDLVDPLEAAERANVNSTNPLL